MGTLLLTLGRPGVAGDGTGPLLNEPCDVHTAPNGDIFVADGHSGQGARANRDTVARIAKFDEFRTPHGLAMDSLGRLYVADRGNVRIQIFDQEGNFIDQWKQFSRLSRIFIDANDMIYCADSESSARPIPVGSAACASATLSLDTCSTSSLIQASRGGPARRRAWRSTPRGTSTAPRWVRGNSSST